MSNPTILYATDEDIALRASTDYLLLCPRDQKVAVGNDGVILPGSPWTLTSATVDFQARGVTPGQVLVIDRVGTRELPCKEGYVVVSTGPGYVTLRRKGLAPGVGEPPVPATGLTGLGFAIMTFGPQIALATDDINRRFGIGGGPTTPYPASLLADPTELRDVTVLTVLCRQYLDASRNLGESDDSFAAKAPSLRAELDDRLGRLTLHRAVSPNDEDRAPSLTRFSTRMSR